MDVNEILLELLVLLAAARLGAEVADRVGLPAVVGEITAGIVLGSSALGVVGGGEFIEVLAELGVIVLLFEVGLAMDVGELGAVGRAALSVATVGVVVPFVAGTAAGLALGMDGEEAVFVGAALTATSVGITARVFGDLRQLATVEARTVLGAAVADDVMGLVILTVVARAASGDSVSVAAVLVVIAVAVVFLVGATVVGNRLVPLLFGGIGRSARVPGTLLALAVVLALGVAQAAHAAQLAPIIGAFVAGLTLGSSPVAPRVRHELAPVSHLLVPVFFVHIGLQVDVAQMARPAVLGLAAALLVVAAGGKLVSAVGLRGAPGDRLVVGLGMLPRGEVGLIFAALGLREGVFGDDVYAALLIVVLATTMAAPPLLRARLLRVRARRADGAALTSLAGVPAGAGVVLVDGAVAIVGRPDVDDALVAAFDAARLAEEHPPHETLLEWISEHPPAARRVDDRARAAFVRLLAEGGPRSWRVLRLGGVLDRALPELAAAIERRDAGAFELDPLGALTWPRLGRLRGLAALATLAAPERALLAALAIDACDETALDPVHVARRTAGRLGLGVDAEEAVAGLVTDRELLAAAARRVDAFDEEPVLHLAVHLGNAERARALHALTLAGFDGEVWERERVDALAELVLAALADPDLTGPVAARDVEARRRAALAGAPDREVRERIEHAPRAYVLGRSSEELLRHAQRCEPPPGRREARVWVDAHPGRGWRVEIVARDEEGLLARQASALAGLDLDILDAVVATWGDGVALCSYHVVGPVEPESTALRDSIAAHSHEPLRGTAVPGAVLHFDDHGSPWHTRCRVEARDVPGVLAAVATAFAIAGVDVHTARIDSVGVSAVDVFELTERGAKLDAAAKARITRALERGARMRRQWVRGSRRPARRGRSALPLGAAR